MTITIGNRHHGAAGEYVGRGTPLGNSFITKPFGPLSRDEACDLYEAWLENQCSAKVNNELVRLTMLYLKKGKLTLVCSCYPRRCHAESIRRAILRLAEEAAPYKNSAGK